MVARLLDGASVAAEVKDELRQRIRVMSQRGVVPGLGTILVGQDPASRSYVTGKHRDCDEVGVASASIELPAIDPERSTTNTTTSTSLSAVDALRFM